MFWRTRVLSPTQQVIRGSGQIRSIYCADLFVSNENDKFWKKFTATQFKAKRLEEINVLMSGYKKELSEDQLHLKHLVCFSSTVSYEIISKKPNGRLTIKVERTGHILDSLIIWVNINFQGIFITAVAATVLNPETDSMARPKSFDRYLEYIGNSV